MKFATISASTPYRAVELADANQLRWTKVRIIKRRNQTTRNFCEDYLAPTKLQGKNLICAGNSDSHHRDSCRGDSGGPLACVQNNTMVLTGIISFGLGCGNNKIWPSFYTRVTYYLDWINQFKVSINITPECCLMVFKIFSGNQTLQPIELLEIIKERKWAL